MKKALSLVLALMMLMTLCITPAVAADPDGSAANPYYVPNPMAAPGFITIPANSTVYYQYKAAVFSGWGVTGYGLTSIIVDGVEFAQPNMWGEIEASFNFNMMSPGIVGYVNASDEDVQVMLTYVEPLGTENNPDTMSEGVNSLSIPANNPSYVSVFLPMVNGEYTFATTQAEDFIISIDVDGTSYTLKDSLTLTLESYIPVYFYVSPIGNTGEIDITITAPKAGTQGNPIWLSADQMDTAYELGTDPLYFQVDGGLIGNELLIESKNGTPLTIELDGVSHTADTGVLNLVLDSTEWAISLVISQDSDAANELYFSIKYATGSMENPAEVELGDVVVSCPAASGSYYYVYNADKDGLLVVTTSSVEGVIGYLAMNNADYSNFVYLAEGATSMMMPIAAGEAITIEVIPGYDPDTFEDVALNAVLTLTQRDLVLIDTFEDGDVNGWSSDSPISIDDMEYAAGWYSAKFEVTKDWVSMYRYVNIEPNTDYTLSFKMKSNQTSALSAKFLTGDWGTKLCHVDVNATEEWTNYEVTLNGGDNTSVVLLLQSNVTASAGQIFWVDDIVLSKVASEEPPVVPEVTYGDANGDGNVNNKDLGLLQQFLNEWEVEIDLAACDVNGDGNVNNKDLGLLQQYLNDWDVVLG